MADSSGGPPRDKLADRIAEYDILVHRWETKYNLVYSDANKRASLGRLDRQKGPVPELSQRARAASRRSASDLRAASRATLPARGPRERSPPRTTPGKARKN